MNSNQYIEKLKNKLKDLPCIEINDIALEINQHINDAIFNGEKEEEVLLRLGDPKTLAKIYIGEYHLKNNNVLKSGVFLITTGLVSSIIIPLLASFIIGFGLTTIFCIPLGIIRTFFNPPWIQMTIFNYTIAQSLSIPFSALLAIISLIILYISWKLLSLYLKYISKKYKKIKSSCKI